MNHVKENLTEIVFLLDRSGSMAGLEGDTIGGFNTFIEKQRQLPGKTSVTTVLFDHAYEVLWDGIDAADVKLTEKDYYVRGMTALLDAVGQTIMTVQQRFGEIDNDDKRKVIFVITTDGMENSSKEFTYEKVKDLINQQQESHGWEFIFMGANIDAVQEAGNIGISMEHAHQFDASTEGVAIMYDEIHEVVKNYRKG